MTPTWISFRSHGDHFHCGGYGHAKESEGDASKPLLQGERVRVCKSAQEFDDDDLEKDGASEYGHKYIVL